MVLNNSVLFDTKSPHYRETNGRFAKFKNLIASFCLILISPAKILANEIQMSIWHYFIKNKIKGVKENSNTYDALRKGLGIKLSIH